MSNKRRKEHTGRGTVGKQPVMGMRERGCRTKAITMDMENTDTVPDTAMDNIMPGSSIYSDEASAYNPLNECGYKHGSVNHSAKEYVNGMGPHQRHRIRMSCYQARVQRRISQLVGETLPTVRQRVYVPSERGKLREGYAGSPQ